MVDFLRWVVAESDDEATAGAAQCVVDLRLGEVAVGGGIADARIGHQKATEGGVGGVAQRAPSIDENESLWCFRFRIHPVLAVLPSGRLVLFVTEDARHQYLQCQVPVIPANRYITQMRGAYNDHVAGGPYVDCDLLVSPGEELLGVSGEAELIPKGTGVVFVGLLAGDQGHHGGGECQFVLVGVRAVEGVHLIDGVAVLAAVLVSERVKLTSRRQAPVGV